MRRSCGCFSSGLELEPDGKYKSILGWSPEGLTLKVKTINGSEGTMELVEEFSLARTSTSSNWMEEASSVMLIRQGVFHVEAGGKRVIMTFGPPLKPEITPSTGSNSPHLGSRQSPQTVEHLAASKSQTLNQATAATQINRQLEALAADKGVQVPQLVIEGALKDKYEMETELHIGQQLQSDPQNRGHYNSIKDCEIYLNLKLREGCFWSRAAGARLEGEAWLAFHPVLHGASSCYIC